MLKWSWDTVLEYKNMLQLKTTYIYILWTRFSPGISRWKKRGEEKKRGRRSCLRDNIGRSVARRLTRGKDGNRHRFVQENEFSDCRLFPFAVARVRKTWHDGENFLSARGPLCTLLPSMEILIFTRMWVSQKQTRRSDREHTMYIFRYELESEKIKFLLFRDQRFEFPSRHF